MKALLAGRLVDALGFVASASRMSSGKDSLPGSVDVAAHLARVFDYPSEALGATWPRVAEYVALSQRARGRCTTSCMRSSIGTARPARPIRLSHSWRLSSAHVDAPRPPNPAATNFDQLLEQAFRGRRRQGHRRRPLSRAGPSPRQVPPNLQADGQSTVVEVPERVHRSVARPHGRSCSRSTAESIWAPNASGKSSVVSEDDYIDYLAQADIFVVLPVTLAAKRRRSHFLFLGYPVDEWSLRVFLHRLFGREKVAYRSWAVVPRADEIEQELWRQRGIDTFGLPFEST